MSRRDLVLVGGGHANVEVLRAFGRQPLPGVRLTLVAREVQAPYSGMVPGLIAGHYRFEEAHIDLARLAASAGARLLAAEAVGLDPVARRLHLKDGEDVPFDLLALNTGGTPAAASVPDALDHAIGVKPVDRLLAAWERVRRAAGEGYRLVVVGGGAGGVELALAAAHALQDAGAQTSLVTDGAVLPDLPERARRIVLERVAALGVEALTGREVVQVEPGRMLCRGGATVPFDALFWATGVGPPAWLKDTGLRLSGRGFVAVDAALRSTSHAHVFAAGDAADVVGLPRPKAGVFAVRQGAALARNLRRTLEGKPPVPAPMQRGYLRLIGLGDGRAVAVRGRFVVQGAWVWRWKQWIDRRFVERFACAGRAAFFSCFL